MDPLAHPDDVARDLAEVTRILFSAGTVEQTLQRIADSAVATVDGCDFAGISLVERGRVSTPVYTDQMVAEVDAWQYETDEGPCLDVIKEETTTFYAADLREDTRWPTFGPRAAAAGMRSLLSFRLFADRTLGALNLYAQLPHAFGATDRAVGLIFAAHAGMALGAKRAVAEEAQRAEHLAQGLASREVIGQAQGILMERERITADQAFEMLRRASQRLNVKLRDVAQRVVDTGEEP